MRYMNRLLGTAMALGFASTPAFAQMGSIVSGGGASSGVISGSPGGTVGSPGSSGGSGMGAGGNSASPGSDISSALSGQSGITAPGANGGSASSVISASNWLGAYYGNPYYQGIPSNSSSIYSKGVGPGGFGSVLYGSGGGMGGGSIGSAAGSVVGGTSGGRTAIGGAGGRGGLGGRGGAGGGADPGGILVQLPIQITHPAIARFPVTPVATSQLQNDIAGMITRSNEIANPAGVSVTVNQGIVTLTGTVRDIEEARTIAGMIRLTPGVRRVQNELTFPKP